MDERGVEVQGPKVGPVLEGATLILTCDIIGGITRLPKRRAEQQQ